MPDYTVKADVDTMLRANDKAAIRSAIGVGTTDVPTFSSSYVSGLTSVFRALTGTGFTSDFGAGGLALHSTAQITWASSFNGFGTKDLLLEQDAAGILAQRNGTAAQIFRVYNAFLGTTSSEWGEINWNATANVLRIGTAHGGTGQSRALEFATSNTGRWQVSGGSGHFLASTDNTYDIGASGAARPRNIYLSGSAISVGHFRTTRDSGIMFAGSATDPLSGTQLTLRASANAVNTLCIGDTTDAFPAIGRDGAGIKFTGAAAGLTSWIKVPAVAVSALPLAATAGVGARSFVNDALSPVFGSAVTGGGAVTVPVYSTGSAWNVG